MKALRIAALQHSPGTSSGTLTTWASDRGHRLEVRRLFAGDRLPDLGDFDWLVSLGGPMNCDDESVPFLQPERRLVKDAISSEKGVLGLCLGGQIIARSFGANVAPSSRWETGWHAVEIEDAYLGRENLTVFQWHQDTFELPTRCKRFATNSITENQAFRFSDRVVGLQFHPETSADWVRYLTKEDPYPRGSFAQSPDEIVRGLEHQQALQRWFFRLLEQIEGVL